jgi:hypothetical protein
MVSGVVFVDILSKRVDGRDVFPLWYLVIVAHSLGKTSTCFAGYFCLSDALKYSQDS